MPRALDQIMQELNSVYNPTRDLYNKQITNIDPQLEAEQKGLDAQREDSFNQITQGANRRGMLFSGIPLEEQARYTGQSYLPAVANLKAKYSQQRFSLQDALSKIDQDQKRDAYAMRDQEIGQENDAAARAASARAAASVPNYGGGNTGNLNAGGFGMQQRKDKGFNFVDQMGNPVSAAQYAAATGVSFRQLLQQMANAGDQGARQALNFSGDLNDSGPGYDPTKIGNQGELFNSLTWGTPYRYQAPAPGLRVTTQSTPSLKVR